MKLINVTFFQNLQEIVTDPIFIGISKADLKKEIETNMWRISVSDEEQRSLTIEELQEFLTQVIENRRYQVIQRKADQQILFYLWYDAQSSHLRFNVISDFETGLPFGCRINLVQTPDRIIKEFLGLYGSLPRLEGMKLEIEAKSETNFEKDFESWIKNEYVLDVFVTRLP